MGRSENGSHSISHLSSSLYSHSPSKSSSSISKTYKSASTLFLTRRLPEAYEALQPIVSPTGAKDGLQAADDEGESPTQAPIATAPSNLRIKIWSLYAALLNAIVDLSSDEGKKGFGQAQWRSIVSQVRDGSVWDFVVQNGYQGREGSVDADVVFQLATLLLGQSPSQATTQQRLETYLSSSAVPDLDLSHYSPTSRSRHANSANGTNTPKDLSSRSKIIELFTLHILPRNEEWVYSREFISNSDILDSERKEVFLQTLQELQDAKDGDERREQALQRERDEEVERQKRMIEEQAKQPEKSTLQTNGHKRTSSEVDYGIESHPNGSAKARGGTKTYGKSKAAPTAQGRTQLSPPAETPKQTRKPPAQQSSDMFTQARLLMRALQNLVTNMASSMTQNPATAAKTVFFLLGIITAFSRRDLRERVQRITATGWQKVRGTVGMGTKVSYI